MTYTVPRTWVAGETVTAALMNTEVRDRLTFGTTLKVASQSARDAISVVDGMTVYREDLHTEEIYDGAAWHYANWYQPWGLQFVATQVTDTAANAGTVTILTAGPFTAVGNRRLKVTASCAAVTQVGAGASQIQIWHSGAIQTVTVTSAAITGGPGGYCSIIDTPAAGSFTYYLKSYTPATSIKLLGGAAYPIQITVEDIGPNGAAV